MLTDKTKETRHKTLNITRGLFCLTEKIHFTLEKIRIFSTVGSRCKQGNG